MSGKFDLRPVMSTCRQSARVSDKMESLPSTSKDVRLGKPVRRGSEWDSDTGITSGSDVSPTHYRCSISMSHLHFPGAFITLRPHPSVIMVLVFVIVRIRTGSIHPE